MNKIIFSFLLVVLNTSFIFGQNSFSTLPLDSAVNNLLTQIAIFPQEKIYLQTDKPYYLSGEKIFFRAFPVDALIHQPAIASRYVYVELINPIDSVVIRQQIRSEKGLFYGTLSIPEDLPQGNYMIRAYTRFQTNMDKEYFFSKNVYIADPDNALVKAEVKYDFINDKQVQINLRFVDAKSQEPLLPTQIPLQLNHEKVTNSKPDKDGWTHTKFNLTNDATLRTLFAELNHDKYLFRQFLRIPYPEKIFDVSFYPEGGNLIDGKFCTVAFKALSSNGNSLDIQGKLFDSNDELIAEFTTLHEGMGSFNFHPQANKRYYAVCSAGDQNIKVDLPVVKTNTFALKTVLRRDKLWITVNMPNDMPNEKIYLLVHTRGKPIYAGDWDSLKEFITIDKEEFPSGVAHILLLTEDYRLISERLAFILNDDQASAKVNVMKKTYRKRENIQMSVQVKNGQTESMLSGNFSISVTDDNDIAVDTTSNILSCILLTSELKGNVCNPAYYFQKNNRKAELAADLLMMTQGWTRYDIPKAMQGNFQQLTIPPEVLQSFSGIVKGGLLSKPYSGANVSILSTNRKYFDLTETNEQGRFSFQVEFPDSSYFIIQALNKKGKEGMMELFVDEITYPCISNLRKSHGEKRMFNSDAWNDYLSKADLKYVYENGMRITKLPELVVRASRLNKNKYQSPYYSMPDNRITEEEMETISPSDIRHLLSRLPSLVITGNRSIRIRNAQGPPLIVVNGVRMNNFSSSSDDDLSVLDAINVSDIAQIDLLKTPGNLAVYGSLGINGVIEIFTKSGKIYTNDKIRFNIKSIAPLGYQTPVEFYSPKYDTQEALEYATPDLRSTIYWKPDIIVDESGSASIEFYAADLPSTYSISIEGITQEGKLIYQQEKGSIEVKK